LVTASAQVKPAPADSSVMVPALLKPLATVRLLFWISRLPFCANGLEITDPPWKVMLALLVNVPVPAQVELLHSTAPLESVAGPLTVNVWPAAKKVAFAELNVKPATVGLVSNVTV
jgi:hypothetical protein